MKIAWVSSWPPRPCGIAVYSAELVEELRTLRNRVHVVCHTDGGIPGEREIHPIIQSCSAGWDDALYGEVASIDPDVVHVQHEYGLYRCGKDFAAGLFRPLFRWKADARFPVVITFHSVYTSLSPPMASFTDIALRMADAGVVHQRRQWSSLPINIGRVPRNLYVIPHGAKSGLRIDPEQAKQRFGLSGRKVVGLIGWFTETKGFHRVLERWDSISRRLGEEAVLLLAGEARMKDQAQVTYRNRLLDLVDRSRARDRIQVVLGSFTPEEYDLILAAFDLAVLPYSFASQSGNLSHCFAQGVPAVVSATEGLKEEIDASGAGVAVAPGDDQELERAVVAIMSDEELRRLYARRAAAYVKEKIAWPRVARKHLTLYNRVKNGSATGNDSLSDPFLES